MPVVCKDLVFRAKEQLEEMIRESLTGAFPEKQPPAQINVEIPADTSHGDFASNIAMVSAKLFGMPPRGIAESILSRLNFQAPGCFFTRAEIAGPGFMNFFLSPTWFCRVLESVSELGPVYGRTNYGKGEKVMVEFVSANPTGPMHLGNARGGAIGDCLASAMDAAGYDVTREFYVNDSGNQIDKFGLSLEARYIQELKGEDAVAFPEDGYHGEDIRDRAREFIGVFGEKPLDMPSGERRRELVDFALPRNIDAMREGLSDYRIDYKVWFHESSLYEDGAVDEILGILKTAGLIYEKDGALWYKATEHGGEKDEVLIRQNGNATYFCADIAYHYNKFVKRGFSRVINIWGADHHGHVARLKGAMDAVGADGSKLDIVLMQLVRLLKDGEPFRMSKRTGRSVSLKDLLELVPVDAARFFFNLSSPKTALDFDLDLAAKQSSENPVYYVQYAHARICSILRKLEEKGVTPRKPQADELLLLSTPDEIELIRLLARLPEQIVGAALSYDPARLTRYVLDVAAQFHKFYTNCHVAGEDECLTRARACLCSAAKTVLANTLALLKISAPESM